MPIGLGAWCQLAWGHDWGACGAADTCGASLCNIFCGVIFFSRLERINNGFSLTHMITCRGVEMGIQTRFCGYPNLKSSIFYYPIPTHIVIRVSRYPHRVSWTRSCRYPNPLTSFELLYVCHYVYIYNVCVCPIYVCTVIHNYNCI